MNLDRRSQSMHDSERLGVGNHSSHESKTVVHRRAREDWTGSDVHLKIQRQ